MMTVAIVRFPAREEALSVHEAREMFSGSAPSYLEVDGLLWKAYLRSDDGLTVGGTYWFRDRASAEAKFNDGWLEGVTAKYGKAPTVEFFDTPVVVDKATQSVLFESPVV